MFGGCSELVCRRSKNEMKIISLTNTVLSSFGVSYMTFTFITSWQVDTATVGWASVLPARTFVNIYERFKNVTYT